MSDVNHSEGKKLRVALFGAGKMGLHHIKAIDLSTKAKLIAIADPRVKQSNLINFPLDNVLMFETAEELLQNTRPDVVHICTPPETHATLAKLALKNGAHIYVEKPFALSIEDTEHVISVANESGLKVCPGHQLLFDNPAQQVKKALREIGDIVHIESYFSFRSARTSYYGRGSISHTEQLIDILPHPVYLLVDFLNTCNFSGEENNIELQSILAKSTGDVHAIFRTANVTGILVVTLRGRPVESYLRVVGTNGCVFADFVRGTTVKLPGPCRSRISLILNPYSQARQMVLGTTKAFMARFLKKRQNYHGLFELIDAFYSSVLSDTHPPLSYPSLVNTVRACVTIENKLRQDEEKAEKTAELVLEQQELDLVLANNENGIVLVTGGTGFLGHKVVFDLRSKGLPVRVIARQIPPASKKIPGVKYVRVDLGENVPVEFLRDVSSIVHCAAETSGGVEEHQRNSITATQNILTTAAEANVKRFIHISSLSALEPRRKTQQPLDESTPLLRNNSRGPYAWGKAESEKLASRLSEAFGITLKIIRLAPLVDYRDFQPPGRLGRELGPLFVAVGPPHDTLSLCEVQTATKIISYYLTSFEQAPPVLNLLDAHPPTRNQLIRILRQQRPDLKIMWVPTLLLTTMSPLVLNLQRFLFNSKQPVDIKHLFLSENYKTDLAQKVMART